MVKEQIKNDLFQKGHFCNKLSDYGTNLWRHFIYGDFSEQDYLNSIAIAKTENKKKMRTFVISNYCSLVAREYGISYSYAQKCMVDIFNKQSLDSINEDLILELIDLNNGLKEFNE